MDLSNTDGGNDHNPATAPRARRGASLRTRLTLWTAAIALLAVAAVVLGGRLMVQASLQDQRQALAEQLRIGFQAQRTLLDRQALWLTSALERTGPVDPAPSSDRWQARLKAVANTLHGDSPAVPEQLTIVDRRGQVVATWRPDGKEGATVPCATVRGLVTRWRDVDRRPLVAGICAGETQARYVALVPLRASGGTMFLEVSSDLRAALRSLEQSLRMPVRLALGDGPPIYPVSPWPAAGEDRLQAEWPIVADTGSKAPLVLTAAQPAGALMSGLIEARTLAVLLVLFAVISIGVLLYWYLDRTLLAPMVALAARLRAGHVPDASGITATHPLLDEMADVAEGVDQLDRQLGRARQEFEQAAYLDPITCLPNRAAFLGGIERAMHASPADNADPLALLILDLDGFKDINDSLGLPVGDALLRQVAQRLVSKLRDSDVVARIGGDEFAMLLPHADSRQAITAARLLLQTLRQPFVIDGQRLDLGASIGMALFPDHGLDHHTLLQRADVALRAAKAGISGYRLYDQDLDSGNVARLALLGDLRRAVEQEEFELYYQPKVNLASGRVTGVEALIRWHHPREGLMLPDRFVPLLEQTGLIRSLTPWLADQAMSFTRRLQELGQPLVVSINLSARELQDPHLADTLAEPLAAHRLDPSLIELEITESALMDEPERACLMLERLASLGFRLAIDDFGTGYSSFSYLKRMPVNTIKIDKSFVLGMLNDSNDAAIVRTSVDLARHLGLQIVAEGVESVEVFNSLRALACDSAQGFYLSRPLTGDALVDWLRHSSWGLGGKGPRATAA